LIKTKALHAGSILFLDEPDNNLNPVMINKFVEILIKLVRGKKILHQVYFRLWLLLFPVPAMES
jgi:ABC-type multidrug transport system ATPase subunit